MGGGTGLLSGRKVVHFKQKGNRVFLAQTEGLLFKSTTRTEVKRIIASTRDNRCGGGHGARRL